jgi:hypothetical protein
LLVGNHFFSLLQALHVARTLQSKLVFSTLLVPFMKSSNIDFSAERKGSCSGKIIVGGWDTLPALPVTTVQLQALAAEVSQLLRPPARKPPPSALVIYARSGDVMVNERQFELKSQK